MEYSDVRHAVKSTFYTNTLCTIKLLVILEYLVSKISLSVSQLDQGLPWGISVKRFNPQFVRDCKRQVTMDHEDVIRMLKISHYLEAVL